MILAYLSKLSSYTLHKIGVFSGLNTLLESTRRSKRRFPHPQVASEGIANGKIRILHNTISLNFKSFWPSVQDLGPEKYLTIRFSMIWQHWKWWSVPLKFYFSLETKL
ncbi:unnamed protein product [Callosobruchus maculatus]|uniref:Uncharacterized protein n=1 Tax=Callosobruchus maculatus TaxID=64391 RepID=A0A653DMM4_CALMS|nr:unnamed protein product [Callosobruchus maculatus]